MSTTTSTTTTTTTTLPQYCLDSDLIDIRPNILDFGVSDWSSQQLKATKFVNRDISAEWYRKASRERGIDFKVTPFNPSLMLNRKDQLTDLTCLKTFQLIYWHLSKESDGDVFMDLSGRYEKMYGRELTRVVLFGIDYDWDSSGYIDYTELKEMVSPRTLKRI